MLIKKKKNLNITPTFEENMIETPPTKILGKERGLAVAKEGKADTETLDTNGIFAIKCERKIRIRWVTKPSLS